MQIKKIKRQLKTGDTVTCLYHSPFDLNLLYILCLAKTGLKIRVIIDDIDNLGILRDGRLQEYTYAEEYFLSKTERTNLRPLSFVSPKNLFVNLSVPELKIFDNRVGIQRIKQRLGYQDTVEHWIRDTTRRYGSYAMAGPDESFGFQKAGASFIEALNQAIQNLKSIIRENFPSYSNDALGFVDWLFKDSNNEGSVSDCFVSILERILERFNLKDSVTIEKMSDQSFHERNKKLYEKFIENTELHNIYKKAISVDGKKSFDDMPFYSISKENGSRLLNPILAIDDSAHYFLAPKVLMLNSLENLILPTDAMNKSNVLAREIMYQGNLVDSNQIFCTNDWLFRISKMIKNVRLSAIEKSVYGVDGNYSTLYDLVEFLLDLRTAYDEGLNDDIISKYKGWIASSTLESLNRFGYPLIFLCLLQEKAFGEKMPDFFKFGQLK